MALFQPGWMNKDYSKAEKCVERLKGEKQLLRVALECPRRSLRMTAARKLTEDASLARLLQERDCADTEELRAYAAARIVDEKLLLPYQTDGDLLVRYRAMKRNGDAEGAFAAVKAVSDNWKTNDRKLLELINKDGFSADEIFRLALTTARHDKFGKALVERLDAAQREQLMREGKTYSGAGAAYEAVKPTQREQLMELARTAQNEWVRVQAVKGAAPLSLAEAESFAGDKETYEMALSALGKGENLWDLYDGTNGAALTDAIGWVRAADALNKLPLDRLIEIARDQTLPGEVHEGAMLSAMAKGKLTDEQVLELAKARNPNARYSSYHNVKRDEVRKRLGELAGQVRGQDTLYELACLYYDSALERLTDTALLARYAAEQSEPQHFRLALERLGKIGGKADAALVAPILDDGNSRELALNCLQALTGEQDRMALLARYGSEAVVNEYLNLLADKQWERNAAEVLRAFYRAGKCSKAIAAKQGQGHARIDDHYDAGGSGCSHSDSHDDYAAFTFEL